MKDVILILTAAGSSERLGTGVKKEYYALNGGTVLSESAEIFFKTIPIKKTVITIPAGHTENARKALFASEYIKENFNQLNIEFIQGDSTRQKSIYKALTYLNEFFAGQNLNDKIVLIHDAARPFVTGKIIADVVSATEKYGAAVPIINPVDTQKEISSDGFIKRHLSRSSLGAVQTPQGFELKGITDCHQKAAAVNKDFTDDSEIWDAFPECTQNRKTITVNGHPQNKKITYLEDLKTMTPDIRIGLGTDLHRLVKGRNFYLGGIEIPSKKGEYGHSDGDVLLHAVCDALLGAAGLGDIGSYFPPEDPKWKNADSKMLTAKVWNDVKDAGYSLINLDCVLEFESPKFIPWRNKVIASIAKILETDEKNIFVKAKTNEKLGAIGKGKAIKAYCTCLLSKSSS